jgi:hypothetical protein
MATKPNIKWRKSDSEKLEKIVRRFNDKIYRTRRNHPELIDILPDTIKSTDKKEKIEQFKTMPRNEFNKYLKSLERFTRKGSEKEVVSKTGNRVTTWEKNELTIKVAQINRERTKERKKVENYEATSRGESLGMKRGEMGSERLNAYNPKKFNFDAIKPGKEWKKFKESVEKQALSTATDEKFKEYKMNYIKAMSRVMGYYGEHAVRQLKQLPAELVTEIFYREQEATIDFVYEKQDMEAKLDIIEEIWQKAYDENPDIVGNQNWSAEEETLLNDWIEKGW